MQVREAALYRHRNGTIYRVLCIAKEEATERPVVVYYESGGKPPLARWTRPLEEFTDGRFEELPNVIS
jgi:hypothetical protein